MSDKETSAFIIGGGGREDQLGQSVAGSVDKVYFAPGNAGTAQIENAENLDFGASALRDIVQFANKKRPQLTIVGPESPLIQGVADHLREKYSLTFGPGADGARLEGSKYFASVFNSEFGIPQPETQAATNYQQAVDIIGDNAREWVIKADEEAGGKGVKEPETNEDAESVIRGMLDGSLADGAGKDLIVFQERLHGPEVSVLVVCDGHEKIILPFSQDHKKLLDGDKGPNTGGMGAYSPVPDTIVSAAQREKIEDIAERAIYGIQKRGIDYRGVLYMGMMLAEERQGDPVVLEYNCRFGDPETQAVLALMQQNDIDVYEMLRSAAEGQLKPDKYNFGKLIGGTALPVCIAAPGYPDKPVTGSVIYGLDKEYPGVVIQHGGTKKVDENIVTAGGRVLYVTGIGQSPDQAAKNAYSAIGKENNGIHFEGMQYRTDIGHQVRTPGA